MCHVEHGRRRLRPARQARTCPPHPHPENRPCHGADGVSAVPSCPKLAGQNRDYLSQALKDYKSGKRKNPIMGGQVQSLSDADMLDLTAYFSKQKGLQLKY